MKQPPIILIGALLLCPGARAALQPDLLNRALYSGQIIAAHQANAVDRAEAARQREEAFRLERENVARLTKEYEDESRERDAREKAEDAAYRRLMTRNTASAGSGDHLLAQAGMGAVQGLRESEARLNQNWQNLENIRTGSVAIPAGSTPLPPSRPRASSSSSTASSFSSGSNSSPAKTSTIASKATTTSSDKSATGKATTSELKLQLFGAGGKSAASRASSSTAGNGTADSPPEAGPLAYTEAWYQVSNTARNEQVWSTERQMTLYYHERGLFLDHAEAHRLTYYVIKEMRRSNGLTPGEAYHKTPEAAIEWFMNQKKINEKPDSGERWRRTEGEMKSAMKRDGFQDYVWVSDKTQTVHPLGQ